MIGIVVVTHGQLAGVLVDAARTIVGDIPRIASVSIGWSDDMMSARDAIEKALQDVGGEEALILTDMFGGTPTNLSLPFLSPRVGIVTGVNLPMVIKLATSAGEESLAEIAPKIRDQGRQGIYLAGALLAPPSKSGAD